MNYKDTQSRLEDIKEATLNVVIAARKLSEVCSQIKVPPTSFKEKERLAKENLNEIYLTEDQRWIADEISQELAGLIPVNELSLRGFLLRSIKKWQLRNNKPIILASQMNRMEQISVGLEILGYLRDYLNRTVYMPNKKLKKRFLDEIHRRMVELYEEILSAHFFVNDPVNQEYILDFEINNWLEGNHTEF